MAAVTRSSSASPSVSLHSAAISSIFPLKSITDVVNFFRRSLEQSASQGTEPDLTLLSIVAGYIELSLTTGDAAQVAAAAAAAMECVNTVAFGCGIGVNALAAVTANADVIKGNSVPFPIVTHELVAGLYKKFQSILAVVEKPKASSSRQATREVIKKVSDVIWHSLIRSSYKDRAHLQNLYSYLSGNKLDCFGVALAVVAGCQLLGYRGVNLAISEDHAWVVFGNKQKVETIEVTWHGKGSEDKRGQDITAGIDSGSWLYLRGLAVICDRNMEVAAIASAINISLSSNSDCVEVAELQQKLLWLLYEMGHLKKYPMALGALGELEEINPSNPSITCEQLYREAIQSARQYYNNHHVYPYTYQGNYYNRLLKYREAFASWADAADVIRLYTYNCRDDDEIYKELLDIANEMIPYVMKTESSGHSARSILRDSEVFANLLRFYDGICQWEEDSLTPILHIGWAKPLVNNITKFDYDIRSQVVIKVPEEQIQTPTQAVGAVGSMKGNSAGNVQNVQLTKTTTAINEAKKDMNNTQSNSAEGNNNNNNHNNNGIQIKKDEKKEIPTTLADLTAACGVKILNPDFLLQGGDQPFAEQQRCSTSNNITKSNGNNNHNNNNDEATNELINKDGKEEEQKQRNSFKEIKSEQLKTEENSSKILNKSETSLSGRSSPSPHMQLINTTTNLAGAQTTSYSMSTTTTKSIIEKQKEEEDPFEFMLKRPVITLYSQKMKGLKDLLLAEKLNTHAISLQVTAQSVASRKVRGIDKSGHQTTSSTYATINIAGASAAAAVAATTASTAAHSSTGAEAHATSSDSIAHSRPKRLRRE